MKSYEKTARAGKKMWMKLKPGETVVFSCILYKSRAHRDRINAKIMQMMKESQPTDMPFAMKRMTCGGF